MNDFVITIPDDLDVFTCDVGTFTFWCREFKVFFATIQFNLEIFVSTNAICYIYKQSDMFVINLWV